ncbi:MAG: HAD family hydrolase [Phycisphaerae bacterium]|nr:HAD family hydrolase [Phycisphaerae bacterium]
MKAGKTKFRLLAVDLDGTLLTGDKRISPRSQAALAQARRAGVHIVLASARPPRSVMPFYTQLELDTPMINYNGALVYDPPSQRVLAHRPIPADMAADLVQTARAQHPDVVVSAEVLDRWFTDRVDDRYMTETARHCRPDVLGPIDEWLNRPVTKLLLLGEQPMLASLRRGFERTHAHQVTMVQLEGFLLQLMHATTSKAQALREVAAELGVAREETLAIGDNANDVGMLQWAGTSVAVANACPEALAVADHIADHHDNDGAAKAIEQLVLHGKN